MGQMCPNQESNSYYRNPTFCYIYIYILYLGPFGSRLYSVICSRKDSTLFGFLIVVSIYTYIYIYI